MSEFQAGQTGVWVYTPRGGYAFTEHITARIVRVNSKTLTVEVRRRVVGGQWETVTRRIKPDKFLPQLELPMITEVNA